MSTGAFDDGDDAARWADHNGRSGRWREPGGTTVPPRGARLADPSLLTASLLTASLLIASLLVAAGWLAAGPAYAVAGGTAAADGEYGFVAHIQVGQTSRACTGALIDPEWVVTAASCFAEDGQAVPAGPPAVPVTVTVGRANLASATGGQVRAVVDVVPHPDRNLALAKLVKPVIDVSPAPIGTTAPAAGESLRVAGFGRTATAWVPERLHTATLAVQSVGTSTIDVAGTPEAQASLCKGDAGGPAFRQTGAAVQLLAVHAASWQAGCLGVPATETRTLATETRLDDIADWIRQAVRGGTYVRLPTSAAVLDTRSNIGAPSGPRAAGSTTTFQVAGVGGVPATGVTAVLVDVTAITTTTATHLSVFPGGTPRNPALSTVNATARQIISNSAVVNLPASGKLAVYTSAGGVHITVDVQGYFSRTVTTGGGFVPVSPTRLVDTRSGLGGSTGTIPIGGSRTFTLTGGVIPAGVSTAFLDMIATGATAQGWIGTYAAGGTNRSVMDYVPGTTAHAVTARLGTDGRATFTNNSGSPVNLVLTASGYYASGLASGGDLRTVTATRLLDTRNVGTRAPLAANGAVDVALGVPAGSTAMVNLTIANNTAAGYLHAWPVGGTEPGTSLLNYPGANTGARAAVAAVPVGTDGKIRIRNVGTGTVHLLVDLQGWYAPATGAVVRPMEAAGGQESAAGRQVPAAMVAVLAVLLLPAIARHRRRRTT